MISNNPHGAASIAAPTEMPAFRNTVNAGAHERIRTAAYDAVEKVLTSMFQPIDPQMFEARWNDAVDAMTKHLENQTHGRSNLP